MAAVIDPFFFICKKLSGYWSDLFFKENNWLVCFQILGTLSLNTRKFQLIYCNKKQSEQSFLTSKDVVIREFQSALKLGMLLHIERLYNDRRLRFCIGHSPYNVWSK